MNCGPSDDCPQRVLVVDASQDSRDVVRAIFERQGTIVLEADEARQGLDLARLHHPQVIVLDLEARWADDQSLQAAFDAELQNHPAALVVLGKAQHYAAGQAEPHVLSKPYHYRALIDTIEQLLAQSRSSRGTMQC